MSVLFFNMLERTNQNDKFWLMNAKMINSTIMDNVITHSVTLNFKCYFKFFGFGTISLSRPCNNFVKKQTMSLFDKHDQLRITLWFGEHIQPDKLTNVEKIRRGFIIVSETGYLRYTQSVEMLNNRLPAACHCGLSVEN